MRQLVIQVPQFWVKMGVKLSFLVRRPTHAFGDYMAVIACVRCTYMTGSGLELLVCPLHGKTLRLQLAVQLTLVAELPVQRTAGGNTSEHDSRTIEAPLTHQSFPVRLGAD